MSSGRRQSGRQGVEHGADMTDSEPIHDLAHLGHVEMFTPRLDESVRFFVDIMGMTESGRDGASVYLRAWDDPADRLKGMRKFLGELAKLVA